MRFAAGRTRWWWIFLTLFTIGFVAGLIALGARLWFTDDTELDRWGKITGVLSGYLALAAMPLTLASLVVAVRQGSAGSEVEPRAVAGRLAERVRRQWEPERALRGLRQPAPLHVPWSSTDRPVSAARDVVLAGVQGQSWADAPLAGDVSDIVAAFRGLPTRQLVVLGDAGTGKSVLALLLTLGLVEEYQPGKPVPVLLSIASWDPVAEGPEDFILRRLREDHPFLRQAVDLDGDLAQRLRGAGLIMPVLDGLDELPAGWHAEAVRLLDQLAAAGGALVVTCRGAEYERVVTRGGVLLSRAAVIEMRPVTVDTVVGFLSHPAPLRSRWEPVFAHLRQRPESDLAQALTTPLMVALARSAFAEPATDPAELLTLSGRAKVRGRLIDAFLDSAYGEPVRPSGKRRRGPRYAVDRARRWLACLAYGMAGARELSWWRINPGWLTRSRAWGWLGLLIIPIGMGLFLSFGILIGDLRALLGTDRFPFSQQATPALTTLSLFLVLLLNLARSVRGSWLTTMPYHAPLRYTSAAERLFIRAGIGSLLGYLTGFICHLPLLPRLATSMAGALLLVAVRPASRTTSPVGRRPPPTATIRRRLVRVATAHTLLGGGIAAAAAGVGSGPAGPIRTGLVGALLFGVNAFCWAGGWEWLRFRFGHLLLAVRGWLPWRLQRFLRYSYRRSVLRRSGRAWQFRHALIQDHLAQWARIELLARRARFGDAGAGSQLAAVLAATGNHDELKARADTGDPAARTRLAAILAIAGNHDELKARADTGDPAARTRLAAILAIAGNHDELKARADTGDPAAAWQLAELLHRRGEADEALAILRRLAAARDRAPTSRDQRWRLLARRRLAAVLAEQGQIDEALKILDGIWLRPQRLGVGVVDEAAACQRIDLLVTHGRVSALRGQDQYDRTTRATARRAVDALAAAGQLEDPRKFYKPARNANRFYTGYVHFTVEHFADLLLREGDEETLRDWASGSHYGSGEASEALAELLARQDRVDDLRKRARLKPDARARLAILLAEKGQAEEAIDLLREGAMADSKLLSRLLAEQDRLDELRELASGGGEHATARLARVLASRGRLDEGIELLQARIDAGDREAGAALVDLLHEGGHDDHLRVHADMGDRRAVARLAELLAARGQVDEAIELLRERMVTGDDRATRRLIDLLVEHDRPDQLAEMVRTGDPFAAEQLAGFWAGQGRVPELQWLAGTGDEHAIGHLTALTSPSASVPAPQKDAP